MSNLTDIYNQISDRDAVYLEKQAAAIKIAEEQDAAGRIMARGFADELHKLAQGPMTFSAKGEPEVKGGFGTKTKPMGPVGGTIKSPGYSVGGGKTGPGPGQLASRPARAPSLPQNSASAGTAPGATFSRAGGLKAKMPKAPTLAGK